MESVKAIMAAVRAEKARIAAANSPEHEPSVTNKRRAESWEARNSEKVKEQTAKRVAAHRARNPEQYREYMRQYMKNKRAKP
jgi:hypothetical protein